MIDQTEKHLALLQEIAQLMRLPPDADLMTDLLPAVRKAVGQSLVHPTERPDSAWHDEHRF